MEAHANDRGQSKSLVSPSPITRDHSSRTRATRSVTDAGVPAALLSMVLGLANVGQAWRFGSRLWQIPPAVGTVVLAFTVLLWVALVLAYLAHATRFPSRAAQECRHPIAGGTPALLGISTFLVAQAVLPLSRTFAIVLTVGGLVMHLAFSIWHTGALWQGGRQTTDTAPTVYLPTVAGNFTGAAALAALGCEQWAWLLFGAGVFSWLALEPLVIKRLWHSEPVPVAQRPMIGIQFAPPAVCASALMVIQPHCVAPWPVMLLGYALFQMAVALRLRRWLGKQAFALSWWAYAFGTTSATLVSIKLAINGEPVSKTLAFPLFVGANVLIGYLCVRSATSAVLSAFARR